MCKSERGKTIRRGVYPVLYCRTCARERRREVREAGHKDKYVSGRTCAKEKASKTGKTIRRGTGQVEHVQER
jgi:hypothetical protein